MALLSLSSVGNTLHPSPCALPSLLLLLSSTIITAASSASAAAAAAGASTDRGFLCAKSRRQMDSLTARCRRNIPHGSIFNQLLLVFHAFFCDAFALGCSFLKQHLSPLCNKNEDSLWRLAHGDIMLVLLGNDDGSVPEQCSNR